MLFRSFALVVLLSALRAQAMVVPSGESDFVSLDGAWRFKLEQADPVPTSGNINARQEPSRLPERPEPFQRLDYREDGSWHDLKVPGNWEMAGYSPATYGRPDNAIGLYRLSFNVPAAWQGKLVKLNFDGVQNGAEIFLNGQPVDVSEPWNGNRNYHEGGYDAFQVDLTPAVRFGQTNLLAVRVYKNTHSVDLDTGDYFFLGGIHRAVTLFAVETTHVEDLTVRTHLLDAGKAELQLILDIDKPQSAGKFAIDLEGEPSFEASVNGVGPTQIMHTIEHPRLWSAEHPHLYKLSLKLLDGQGRLIERIDRRIGIREVAILNGVLLVNGQPVKLTGICRHELDPALGSACDETVWRRDLSLMRAANINAIRTSHYPYASGFYDLCDQMGFYVADEMAACWVPTDTSALTPAFQQHARELVQRDKNHPSVIIWAIGNENKPGKNNRLAADEIRKLDPTRPRLVSTEKPELADVELDDAHYPTPSRVTADVNDPRRNIYPMIYLENPNIWEVRNGSDYGCLDLWGSLMDRAWSNIWKDDHLAGSFLWEWRDRAVADLGPVHLYDFDPVTGINTVKVKGLCDGFGNPRADYYSVKMVYAPIKVNLRPKIAESTLVVHASNRFSFTDLSELNTTWHLLSHDKALANGLLHLKLAPNREGDLEISLPADSMKLADSLLLQFDHPDGLNIATYQLPLASQKSDPPSVASPAVAIKFPHLNFTTVTYAPNQFGWHWATRHRGDLTNIKILKANSESDAHVDATELYNLPLVEIRSVDADLVLTEKPQTTVGHIHAAIDHGKFSYVLQWMGSAVDIQEFGWAFAADKTENRFSWHRQGYWSWYPPDHIGRITGTATPDSADVHITKITRPDAFDFNSTKYNCDWVSLTDSTSHGIQIRFDSDDRHHCRADFGPDGTYRLVVNKQASPPRDLSSSVVPDLYLKLKLNSEIAGHFTIGGMSENQ